MKYLKYIFTSICIVYFPVLFLVSFFLYDSWFGYGFALLAVALVSLPFYFAFIQLGRLVSAFVNRGGLPCYKRIFILIETLIIVVALSVSVLAMDTVTSSTLICTFSLIVLWLAELIVGIVRKEFKGTIKGFFIKTFLSKGFLITLAVVLAVGIAGVFTFFSAKEYIQDQKNQKYLEELGDFEVWHNTPKITCKRGERGEIVVHLKNHVAYEYTGASSEYRPSAKLIYSGSDTEYEIAFEELPHTTDYNRFTIAPSTVKDITLRFVVPKDAPLGSYDIEMWFGETRNTQVDVLNVIE